MGHRDVALGDREEARKAGLGGEQIVPAGIEGPVGRAIADRQESADRVEEEAEVHAGGHRLRARREAAQPLHQRCARCRRALQGPAQGVNVTWGAGADAGAGHRAPPQGRDFAHRGLAPVGVFGQGRDAPREGLQGSRSNGGPRALLREEQPCPGHHRVEVARVTGDGRAERLRPDHHVGRRPGPPVAIQGAGLRPHRAGESIERAQPLHPLDRGRRRRVQRRHDRVERRLETLPGRGVAAPVDRPRPDRFPHEVDRVGDPGERGAAGYRLLHHLPTGMGEGDEVTGEVAAVDR